MNSTNTPPKTIMLTATQARTQFFDLIEAAFQQGQIAKITRHGRVVAEIRPPEAFDYDRYLALLKNFKPIFTDEDVEMIKKVREDSKKPRFPDW